MRTRRFVIRIALGVVVLSLVGVAPTESRHNLATTSTSHTRSTCWTTGSRSSSMRTARGDIDPETARQKVERYFGAIPDGADRDSRLS